MALSPSSPRTFASPKRKREDSSPCDPGILPSKSQSAAGFHTFPILLAQQAANDDPPSNQTFVTGKFQNLAIRANAVRNSSPPIQHDRKRLAAMPVESAPNERAALLREYQLSLNADPDIRPPSAPSFEFESLPMVDGIPDSSRRRSRSPPLNGEPQDNFWHDSEITGHNPTDPSDDGYGINGIGFKPTPAIAWARSQKRKQQLADYKSRETKEARQRRIERRRVSAIADSEKENEDQQTTKTKVRFEGD